MPKPTNKLKSPPPIPEQLTFVVNFWPVMPAFGKGSSRISRNIGRKPIYKLEVVQQHFTVDKLNAFTKGCRQDLAKWGWDINDTFNAIQKLRQKDYLSSAWCEDNHGNWAACDGYCIPNHLDTSCDPPCRIDLYIKFAVSLTGKVLLIFSFHPSNT